MFKKIIETFSKKSKFTEDFFFILFASGLAGFSAIFIQSIIGGFSSTENIGIYAQVFTLYVFFTTISNFGIETSTLKHASVYPENLDYLKNVLSTSSILISLISFIIIAVLYFAAKFFPEIFSSVKVLEGFIYSLPAIFLFALNKNFSSFLSGLRIISIYSIIRSSRWLLILIFSFLLLWYNLDFKYFFLSFVLSELIIFCFFIVYLSKYLFLKLNFYWFKIHLKYGITNLTSLIFSILSSGVIIIISGYYLSEIHTSKVSFIVTFSSIFILISNSIQINFNPVFAKKWSENDNKGIQQYLNMIFTNTLRYSFLLYLFSLISYVIYCYLFMGNEFSDTIIIYAIFSLSTLITFIFSWPSVMLFLAGKIIQNLYRSIAVGSFNVLISFFSIKYLGFYGAAIAVLSNSIISLLITYSLIKYYLNINLYSNVSQCLKTLVR